MKVLLVTLYFPPAGGGGVQRPLKFATHLPALGIETHVLAPDEPEVGAHATTSCCRRRRRGCTACATSARAGAGPSEELHGKRGLERARDAGAAAAAPARRPRRGGDLEPDGDPGGARDRARGGDRRRAHDLAARLGASRRRGGEARDRRRAGSPTCATRCSRTRTARSDSVAVRVKGRTRARRRRARRAPRRRDRHRVRLDRRGDARARRRRAAS